MGETMSKPRTFTSDFKAQVALAALKGDKPLAALCREFQVSDSGHRPLETTPAGTHARAVRHGLAGPTPRRASRRTGASHRPTHGGVDRGKKGVADARLSVARRRELVASLRDEFPLATLCRVSGLSPSSFHNRPQPPTTLSYGPPSSGSPRSIRGTVPGGSRRCCDGSVGE
jgi:hypothetical protein